MTTVLAFAVVITLLVFVHELGHFLAARWFGVPVEVFSVGFGPRLWSVRRGGVEYRLSAIPFGGYVKMAGASGLRRCDVPDGFDSKSPWQRFLILLAGPAMNVGFAFMLATAALWFGIELPAHRSAAPVVGAVVENSPAHIAGLRDGDRILTVAERAASTWSVVDSQIVTHRNQNIALNVRRGDSELAVVLPAASASMDSFSAGMIPDVHPVITAVAHGSAAARAGLMKGDVVQSVDGARTNLTTSLDSKMAEGRAVSLTVIREGQVRDVRVTPGADDAFGAVAAIPTALFRPEPLDAFTLGARAILGSSVEILRTIAGLVTGEISPSHLIGPVGLAQIAGESSQLGWRALLAAIAFISLNLGLCNLLPIPILDGGHMLMMVVEGVTRRDVPFRLRKVLVGAGAVAMLLLLVTTFYNDLGRLGWLPL